MVFGGAQHGDFNGVKAAVLSATHNSREGWRFCSRLARGAVSWGVLDFSGGCVSFAVLLRVVENERG